MLKTKSQLINKGTGLGRKNIHTQLNPWKEQSLYGFCMLLSVCLILYRKILNHGLKMCKLNFQLKLRNVILKF